MFEIPAAMLSWFYGAVPGGYVVAIALMSVVVMGITTPLTLKSTKGMLEMQRLAPEMRKLQTEHRDDRQKLNEEMMKLYQEHKVNPMASCLPIVAQMPIFIIMFRVLRGLIYEPVGSAEPVSAAVRSAFDLEPTGQGFIPRYLAIESDLYQSLFDKFEMKALGLDLSLSAFQAVEIGFVSGLPYALLVVLLGGLYFVQQRMVAARAAVSPTMSPTQQKLMQYLPVVFAIFQLFFLSALVVYYIFQTLLRIAEQGYITRKFYGHDEALGRQAQRAGEAAREEAKKSGENGGMFAQAKRDLTGGGGNSGSKAGDTSDSKKKTGDTSGSKKKTGDKATPARPITNKRVTPAKSRPQAASSGTKGRPTPSRKEAQAKRASRSTKPKTTNKKRR